MLVARMDVHDERPERVQAREQEALNPPEVPSSCSYHSRAILGRIQAIQEVRATYATEASQVLRLTSRVGLSVFNPAISYTLSENGVQR